MLIGIIFDIQESAVGEGITSALSFPLGWLGGLLAVLGGYPYAWGWPLFIIAMSLIFNAYLWGFVFAKIVKHFRK